MRSLLLIIICSLNLFGQGFDWQSNVRMPFKIPDLYIGGNAFYTNEVINSHFVFVDGEDNNPCCDFTDGSGSGYGFGFTTEYWFKPKLAINASLTVMVSSAQFTNQSQVPISPGNFLISEFNYTLNRNRLEFVIGAKHRIPFYSFNVGFQLVNSLYLSSNKKYTETIISPSGLTFEDGSSSREISRGIIPDFASYVLIPQLTLSKDLTIRNNIYASPYFNFGGAIFNELIDENWNSLRLVLGVKVYYGLK